MTRLAMIRLFAAVLVTLAALPYLWSRVYVGPMILGEVEPRWIGGLIAGLLVTAGMSWGVGRALAPRRWPMWVLLATAIAWVAILGTLILLMTRPTPATPAFAALFLPATLWAPWLGWIGYGGVPARWKWVVLGVLLVCIIPFRALVRVDGLAGDTLIEFAWRASPRRGFDLAAGSKPADVPKLPVAAGPDDVPQYFGPRRDGVWKGPKLADWSAATPVEQWRVSVGPGWGGIAVVGDLAYTQEQRADLECVSCYRVTDGTPVWSHGERTRFDSAMGGDGPRATPAVALGRVYAVGATGRLTCLDAGTGKKLWSVDLVTAFGGPNLMHGVSASPLIDGDRVIVCPPAAAGPTLAAFQRETGQKLWAAGGSRSSYSSPVLWEYDGSRQIVIHNEDGLAGHDPADGHALWNFPWTNPEKINCSQPVLNAAGVGTILVSTGYGSGAALVRVKRDGPDRWITEEAWKSHRRAFKTKFTSAVFFEDNVYALDDGILACLEAATGKLRWRDGRYQHGQVICVGDRLIVQAESGDLVMVNPSPAGLKEVARIAALPGKTWNVPTLTGRRLIVRNDREMACFELAVRTTP